MRGRRRYPRYKASGVEWLGDVSEGWEVKRLSWLFYYKKGPNAAELTKENIAENPGPFPVFSGQTENDGLLGSIDTFSFDYPDPVIFVTTVGARAMTTRLVSSKFSLSQNCALIIPREPVSLSSYFERVLSVLFEYERRSISLIMQPSLRFEDLDKFRVPLPPLPEQQAIAAYLDRETAKIDTLVSKKQQLIEKLKERRTALISRTVTKGLPPDEAKKHGLPVERKLKPSGVEWLGDVPEGWEVKRLSRAFRMIGSGTTPRADFDGYYEDGEIPWVTTSELRETVIFDTKSHLTLDALEQHSALKMYPPGTLLFAMYGATIGRMGILGIHATTNQACCAFAEGTTLTEKFLFYWLLARKPVLLALSSGGGQPNLSQDDLREIRVPAPPLPEQQAIAAYLDRETAKIDTMISKTERAITLLQEYRTSLITAAVTGKIDVREQRESSHFEPELLQANA